MIDYHEIKKALQDFHHRGKLKEGEDRHRLLWEIVDKLDRVFLVHDPEHFNIDKINPFK